MKKLLLIGVLPSILVFAQESGVYCVDRSVNNALFVAKAIGDADYIANHTPSDVYQTSISEVVSVDGLDSVRYEYHSVVSQGGVVNSVIESTWEKEKKLCIKLIFN